MSSNGRLAGEATTDAATNAVATVATLRSIPPARRSIKRACTTAQINATNEVTAASASENGNRPAKSRSSIGGSAISMIVSAAQYASLIVVMRPTSSASVFWRGRGSGSAAGDWSTMSRRSRMPFAQKGGHDEHAGHPDRVGGPQASQGLLHQALRGSNVRRQRLFRVAPWRWDRRIRAARSGQGKEPGAGSRDLEPRVVRRQGRISEAQDRRRDGGSRALQDGR